MQGIEANISMAWEPGCRRHLGVVCGLLSSLGENCGVCDVVEPADAHNAADGFCVERIEAFLLSFGKCP